MIRYRSWSALFLLASLIFAVLLWLQMTQPDAPDPQAGAGTPPTRAVPERDARPPTRLRPLRAYSAIAERPLFSPTRRPAESAPTAPADHPRKSRLNLVLVGTVVPSDDLEDKYALLRESGSPTTQRLSEGQSIAGWRIKRILPDRVIVESGDETAAIELWTDTQPARTPAGARQAPQQPSGKPPQPGLRLPTPRSR